MMNFALVYAKTAKGIAEAQRPPSGTITPAMRRILIMVDGKRTAAELELVAREGEFDGIAETLQSLGLIEEVRRVAEPEPANTSATSRLHEDPITVQLVHADHADQNPTPPAAAAIDTHATAANDTHATAPDTAPTAETNATPAAPVPAAPPATSLEEWKRLAMRELYNRIGPYGEESAARIQGSKTEDALRYAVQQAGRRIASMRNEHDAQEYLRKTGLA